jgi:hypothetical protein
MAPLSILVIFAVFVGIPLVPVAVGTVVVRAAIVSIMIAVLMALFGSLAIIAILPQVGSS